MKTVVQISEIEAAAIILELRRRELEEHRDQQAVTAKYNEWITAARPGFQYHAPHFLAMHAMLDRVTSGEIRRARFQIPIRHGKSESNTIGYAAYRLKRDPTTKIVVASYNQTQANKFSREIRKLFLAQGGKISEDRDAAGDWETAQGGGVRAVGAGSGLASVNADLIIIDDPIGSRDDAESQAKRDQVWDWLTNDILARCEPHTAVIFTMSRWHQDDPAGRIDDRFGGSWTTLDLPGEAEEGDPLGRKLGAPLWPEMRGAAWLEEKRIELLEYGYASLIQGRPRPRSGGMFKWEWWKKLDVRPKTGKLIRYWDMAGTRPKGDGHNPDWTAGVLERLLEERRDEQGKGAGSPTSIAHVCRFRAEVAARDSLILDRAEKDIKVYGKGVIYWLERQAGIGGEEATANLTRKLRNLGLAVFSEVAPSKSKVERAKPLASACMAGDVYLEPDDEENPWHDTFRNEYSDFTGSGSEKDDQVDAGAGAYNKLNIKIEGKPVKGSYSLQGMTRI